jgi:hypothetical protein
MTTPQSGLSFYRPIQAVLLAALLLVQSQTTAVAREAPVPAPKSPPSVYALLYVARNPGVTNLEEYRKERANSFKGSSLAILAMQDPKVRELKIIKEQEKPVDWLKGRLRTEYLEGTGVFKFFMEGSSPEEQAIILNAIMKEYDRHHEQPDRKVWERHLEAYKKSLPGDQASLKSSEAMLSPDELARLPKQLDRDEYIKSIEKEIANKKAAIKKTEEGIANTERLLKAWPLIRVVEWAEAPAPK